MKTATGRKPAVKKSPAGKTAARKGAVPMTEIRSAAKSLGIPSFGRSKMDLVRAIQAAEGNFDCFGTAESGYCDQTGCRWHADCLEESTRPSK